VSQRELARLILNRRAAKGRKELFGIDRMRFRQIEALARLLGASNTDELANAETSRLETTSALVCALADASRATILALQDPLLATRSFATVPTPSLRSLTVEDVVEVFDYERLGGAASVLATALLGSAAVHNRFDDLRLGMRLMSLCGDGRLVDAETMLHHVVATTQALLSVSCVSSLDISMRVAQLQLFSRFLPAGREYGDPHVQALAEQIAHIDAGRFVVETVQPQREDVIERLQDAFRASRHWAYLDDLIAYCEGPRTDETHEEKEDRLHDLAVFQSWRALMRHSLADHDASITAIHDATPSGQSSAFVQYASRAFRSNRAPYLESTGLPLYERVEDSNARDVSDDDLDLDDVRPGLAIEAAVEGIRVRTHRDGLERDSKRALLRAMAAAKAAEDKFAPNEFLMSEAHTYGMIAYALYKADETPGLDESTLAGLAEIIGEPRAGGTPYEHALDAALTLLTERRDAFPTLRRALARASAIAHVLEDRDPLRTFGIYRIELYAILGTKDALAKPTDAEYARLLAWDLLSSASRLALTNDDRRSSSRLLAEAALLVRELALAFCRYYEPEAAVELAEMVSGIAARARLSDAGEITAEGLEAFLKQTVPAQDTPSAAIICGSWAIIVLARPPGRSWEITYSGTTAGAHVLGLAAEDMGSQLVTLRHYTEQLEEFLRHLWNQAAVLTTITEGPVLYLPSGPPLLFASTLLRGGEHGLASTPPVVIGSLSQRHADRAATAVSIPMRVAVLIGRDAIDTSGQVDAAQDGAIIAATGCVVTEAYGTTLADGLSGATCVHYAGHLASTGPDETVLALIDGDISIESIRMMQLMHIELAVLMACDTSKAPMGYSAEQCEHAAGAFLEAGVGAVIGTLWPVFDRPALIFTKVFYEELAHGTPLGRAFDRAVDGVREHRFGQLVPYAHSAYWGAFTLLVGPGVSADRCI